MLNFVALLELPVEESVEFSLHLLLSRLDILVQVVEEGLEGLQGVVVATAEDIHVFAHHLLRVFNVPQYYLGFLAIQLVLLAKMLLRCLQGQDISALLRTIAQAD